MHLLVDRFLPKSLRKALEKLTLLTLAFLTGIVFAWLEDRASVSLKQPY